MSKIISFSNVSQDYLDNLITDNILNDKLKISDGYVIVYTGDIYGVNFETTLYKIDILKQLKFNNKDSFVFLIDYITCMLFVKPLEVFINVESINQLYELTDEYENITESNRYWNIIQAAKTLKLSKYCNNDNVYNFIIELKNKSLSGSIKQINKTFKLFLKESLSDLIKVSDFYYCHNDTVFMSNIMTRYTLNGIKDLISYANTNNKFFKDCLIGKRDITDFLSFSTTSDLQICKDILPINKKTYTALKNNSFNNTIVTKLNNVTDCGCFVKINDLRIYSTNISNFLYKKRETIEPICIILLYNDDVEIYGRLSFDHSYKTSPSENSIHIKKDKDICVSSIFDKENCITYSDDNKATVKRKKLNNMDNYMLKYREMANKSGARDNFFKFIRQFLSVEDNEDQDSMNDNSTLNTKGYRVKISEANNTELIFQRDK